MIAKAKSIAKARVTVEFAASDLHDKALDIWQAIRSGDPLANTNEEVFDCPLCKGQMIWGEEHIHKPDCAYAIFEKAIDAFGEAVAAALPPLPSAEEIARKGGKE